jgi:hypothetical protein
VSALEIEAAPEVVSAEADDGDFQRSDLSGFHAVAACRTRAGVNAESLNSCHA